MREVRVSKKGADRLLSGHVWVFASDVEHSGGAQGGEVVKVVDAKGRGLGVAHYSSASQIALRLLSPQVELIGRDFLKARLRAALDFRRRMVSGSEAYRLVHAEADQLPALVVDRYGDCFALQTLSQGMERWQSEIVKALVELAGARTVVARNDAPVRQKENLPRETKVLVGEAPAETEVTMNGLRFRVDLLRGQKTGIYLDQRENYQAAARHAHGKALDCFTSTGGFALHLASRCESVEGVDSSREAIAQAEENRKRNAFSNIAFKIADAFDLLAGYCGAQRRFDTIVLDPPAFAKSKAQLEGAARGYREINARAMRMLPAGGILVTCSCSHHFSEAMLMETVAAAALEAGKRMRVLERRTQASDHPILLTVPETHYLKCLILEVL